MNICASMACNRIACTFFVALAVSYACYDVVLVGPKVNCSSVSCVMAVRMRTFISAYMVGLVAQLKWSQLRGFLLVINLVTSECIYQILWFLAYINYIKQQMARCQFYVNECVTRTFGSATCIFVLITIRSSREIFYPSQWAVFEQWTVLCKKVNRQPFAKKVKCW